MDSLAVPAASVSSPYTGGKKDYLLGLAAGFVIGLLVLPILKNAKPDLYDLIALVIVPLFTLGVPLGLVIASFIAKKIPLVWQLAKFLVIGVMNTLVDIGVLALITILVASRANTLTSEKEWFTMATLVVTYYSLYKGLSFIIANINSYFWNKYWTFGSQSVDHAPKEFLQFFFVSIVGFAINVIVASVTFSFFTGSGTLTVSQAGLIGAAMGSVLGLVWNFVGYKFFVFKQ